MKEQRGVKCVVIVCGLQVETVIISPDKLKVMDDAKMDGKQFEKVQNLHLNWYVRAMNSLMGAVGREMYLKMARLVFQTLK
jgi:uncharacterized membrane protein